MSSLEAAYRERYSFALEPVAAPLQSMIDDFFSGFPRIDKVTTRPKSIDSFVQKAATQEKGVNKYSDPLNEIQDQLGARIVCYFLDDIAPVAERVLKYFSPIEIKSVVPDKDSEFGYFGKHFVLILPSDLRPSAPREDLLPEYFEFQIKTLYQHAWAQANHDIIYKPLKPLSSEDRRKSAFTAAQSWGADLIFSELHRALG